MFSLHHFPVLSKAVAVQLCLPSHPVEEEAEAQRDQVSYLKSSSSGRTARISAQICPTPKLVAGTWGKWALVLTSSFVAHSFLKALIFSVLFKWGDNLLVE